jgi:membrane protein
MTPSLATLRTTVTELRTLLADREIGLWAQAIAFKALVTTGPLLVLATGVAGWVLRGPEAFDAVARFLQGALPVEQAQALLVVLEQVQATTGPLLGIGGAGLLLSVVSLVTTLRSTVGHAVRPAQRDARSWGRGVLVDLRVTAVLALLMLGALGLSVAVDGGGIGPRILGVAGSFALATALFAQLYVFLPHEPVAGRSALVGGAVAAGLWEAVRRALAWLAAAAPLAADTPAEGAASLAASFGLVVAFVTWIYYSGLVLLLGAVIAAWHDARATSDALPNTAPDAEDQASRGA